jgi:hypothetical protein
MKDGVKDPLILREGSQGSEGEALNPWAPTAP